MGSESCIFHLCSLIFFLNCVINGALFVLCILSSTRTTWKGRQSTNSICLEENMQKWIQMYNSTIYTSIFMTSLNHLLWYFPKPPSHMWGKAIQAVLLTPQFGWHKSLSWRCHKSGIRDFPPQVWGDKVSCAVLIWFAPSLTSYLSLDRIKMFNRNINP